MAVHSLHIFDRKGKTLFTKRYARSPLQQDAEQMSEQRKLVFGMLFSLRELSANLAPEPTTGTSAGLHSVRTGAGTLHNFETVSGLRFALYTTNDPHMNNSGIRAALQHIYSDLWVESVVRSPLYKVNETPHIASTNFEAKLDSYLNTMPWFR